MASIGTAANRIPIFVERIRFATRCQQLSVINFFVDMSPHAHAEYTFAVATNNIHEAVAKVGREFYTLVKQGLLTHGEHASATCEFEEFARDVLAALEAHPGQLRWSK